MSVLEATAATGEAARHDAAALTEFARRLLLAAGMTSEHAAIVADVLVEGDLMGHSTHGLALLAPYLDDIGKGRMTLDGEPDVISDRGAVLSWDGRFLPGPWLVVRAIELALARLTTHGTVTIVIRRSHHIACLAAYLKRATDRGAIILLTCSDPSVASVAPHGAIEGRYTPNPIAAGWPTDGEPVLVDISASTTTNGLTARLRREGKGARLGGPWLVDGHGRATDDPGALFVEPRGAILPLGGLELGHKGYGLGLLVEALTSGLGGYGRSAAESRWTANVFLQLVDPAAFGGLPAFVAETRHMAHLCRTARVKQGAPRVRLPGERGLALRARQLREGLALHEGIMPGLKPWAERLGVTLPAPIASGQTSDP